MRTRDVANAWVLFKYSLVKRRTIPYFQKYVRSQRLSPDELEHVSWNAVKSLLSYAYEKVPFYRRRFAAMGLHPNDIVQPDDYSRVPVLARVDLREHFQEIISVDARPRWLQPITTGGSTGEPVKVLHDRRTVSAALEWRVLSWWGLPPAVNCASVYRCGRRTWAERMVARAMLWPAKKIHLNAAAMNAENMEEFIKRFTKLRPEILHGYVGGVDHLASFMEANSVSVPPPKAIWVTSAPLTAVQERHIEKAFGAPVYDQYGCCEVFWLAAQCPAKKGLHVFHDARRIEFLDEQNMPCPVGALGRVAVTDLENYVFPIIRYINGDMGRALPGRCECGISLPLMDKVRGRVSDIVRLPNGKCISGEYLTTIFDDYPDAVRQFAVHQYADYSVAVSVVPNPDRPGVDGILNTVADKLRRELAGLIPVEIRKTDSIPHERGKLHFVTSDVK